MDHIGKASNGSTCSSYPPQLPAITITGLGGLGPITDPDCTERRGTFDNPIEVPLEEFYFYDPCETTPPGTIIECWEILKSSPCEGGKESFYVRGKFYAPTKDDCSPYEGIFLIGKGEAGAWTKETLQRRSFKTWLFEAWVPDEVKEAWYEKQKMDKKDA